MTPLRRFMVVAAGVFFLIFGYFSIAATGNDTSGRTFMTSAVFSSGFLVLIAGLIVTINGVLGGIRYATATYYIIGGALLFSGYYVVYGGIDIIHNGIEMRDALFSPGIALMGTGMFVIARTFLAGRL